jgi:hypothetical protein
MIIETSDMANHANMQYAMWLQAESIRSEANSTPMVEMVSVEAMHAITQRGTDYTTELQNNQCNVLINKTPAVAEVVIDRSCRIDMYTFLSGLLQVM